MYTFSHCFSILAPLIKFSIFCLLIRLPLNSVTLSCRMRHVLRTQMETAGNSTSSDSFMHAFRYVSANIWGILGQHWSKFAGVSGTTHFWAEIRLWNSASEGTKMIRSELLILDVELEMMRFGLNLGILYVKLKQLREKWWQKS